jgi:hypothetical protein
MKKIAIIKQSQLEQLQQKWTSDISIAKQIAEDIVYLKSRINESYTLNEGVIDVLKNYVGKGLMNAVVAAALLGGGHVSAQQLAQAGVPEQNIERAIQINNGGTHNSPDNKKIENAILHNLARAGMKGTLNQYNSLPQEQKLKIIDFVNQQIKNGKQLDDVIIKISDYVKGISGGNAAEIDNKIVGKQIRVDTIMVQMKLPIKKFFVFNEFELQNPDQLKKMLQDTLNSFLKVDSITIDASASTLRNKEKAEGLTWMQLSQKRADAISQLLNGMEYNLGGKNVNPTFQISSANIKVNVKGQNGDGTSGPPSPYEVDPGMIQNYQERGIDPKFWNSNAKGDPLTDIKEYEQFQWVNVIIYGKMVETDTKEIINFKYVSLMLDQTHKGQVKKIKPAEKNVNVLSCPIH